MGQVLTREHSSVGLEHLPYKQRVGGSTPSAPTKPDTFSHNEKVFFYLYHNEYSNCDIIRRISAASSASARSATQIEAAGTPDWSTAEGGIPLKGDVTK